MHELPALFEKKTYTESTSLLDEKAIKVVVKEKIIKGLIN